MKKRKNLNAWLAMSIFLLGMGGMAGGSAVDSNSIVEDGIEYYIQTDKAVYNLGEEVQMLYRVTNLGNEDVTFSFPHSPEWNFWVEKDGEHIWRAVNGWYMVMIVFTLSSGESKEFPTYSPPYIWNMRDNNDNLVNVGEYDVIGGLYAGTGEYDSTRVSVHIEIFPEPAMIYYVDADATGANDGSSWTDAYNYLQDALAPAFNEDEIRAAQGTYKPDQGVGITPGDRTATFQLVNGVTIKGGYAGFGQPDADERDIDEYETILSGDLNGDDGPNFDDYSENSYHVVTAYEADETTCLEGFTISGGNANGKSGFSYTGYDGNDSGGGMLINASWPTEHSSPIISNCLFRDNRAVYGAGIYSYRGPATIENCIFEGNIAERYGGGIHNVLGGTKIVRSCLFIDNQAFSGGGLHYFYSRATVTNCVFAGNFAHFDGSAIVSPTGTVTNCTFYGNHVDDDTAVVVNGMGELYIINSILWDDTHTEGYYEIAALTYVYISHCDVRGGEAGVYIHPWGLGDILNWGPGNIDADPFFAEPGYWADANDPNIVVEPNDPNAVWIDGDYHLLADSPCIDAGDPNYVAEPNETDLDGKPRVIGGRIDMGAYEYSPPVQAEVRIVPRTINLTSKGKWITALLWLSEDYNVADIDPNSIFLEYEIQAESVLVDEQQQFAIAKFSRSEVQGVLNPPMADQVELTITGQLTDGTTFEGTDVIRVIDKGRKSAK